MSSKVSRLIQCIFWLKAFKKSRIPCGHLLAAEHGTDRVETILDTKKNEWRSIKVIGKNNFVRLWSDVTIRNRLTARPEIGIATFQHVVTKSQCDRANAEFYLPHENDRIKCFILPTGHSNYVPKLHGNLQQKGAFGENVHEAKETILVNDHVT